MAVQAAQPKPWNPYLHPPKQRLTVRFRKRESVPWCPPPCVGGRSRRKQAYVCSPPSKPQPPPPLVLIDNSRNFYIPIYLQSCGVQVMCRMDVLFLCPLVLRDLNTDLRQCLEILPPSLHAFVRRTRIWVNHTYAYGPQHKPIVTNHSTAHHHQEWLLRARDRPDKALGIEIYNCFDYRRMRLHWNGCGLILHELCHLIHQIVLPDGLDNLHVQTLFDKAKRSGLYNCTLRRDWAGMEIKHDMHYCLVDHKEFFAEMSVTYLASGYNNLDDRNKSSGMESCSPPIKEPRVLALLQSSKERNGDSSTTTQQSAQRPPPCSEESSALSSSSFGCFFDPLTNNLTHCNKFFPFTRGQLKHHDPELFTEMDLIWAHIAEWDGSVVEVVRGGKQQPCPSTDCWAPWRRRPVEKVVLVDDTVML